MKYVDLRAIRVQGSARRKELNESIQPEISKTYEAENLGEEVWCRNWSLGTLPEQRWHSKCELIIAFAGFDYGEDPIPQLIVSYTVPDGRARDIGAWSVEQIEQLLEIRRVFTRWIKGEIDELPPSGIWSEVRPASEVKLS